MAHNKPFDEGCLKAVFAEYDMEYPGYEFYCTLAASRRCLKLRSHQLHLSAAACGYEMENHHHALRPEPYHYRKVNKRLKYAMYASIGICIILLVSQSFFLDPMDYRKYTVLLWLRGFAGIFGLIFFILTGILVYRVNAEYFKDRAKVGGKSE